MRSQTVGRHWNGMSILAGVLTVLLAGPVKAQGTANSGFGMGFGNFGLGTNSFGLSSGSQAQSTNSGGAGTATGTAPVTLGQNLGGFDRTFGASTFSQSGGNNAAAQFGRLGGLAMLGGLAGRFGGGFGGGFGGFGRQNNQQNQTAIRTTIRLGFQYVPPTPGARSAEINARLARIPLPAGMENVRVQMEGRKAILIGSVTSPDDLELLERLVQLEPGVDEVESRLNIAAHGENTP